MNPNLEYRKQRRLEKSIPTSTTCPKCKATVRQYTGSVDKNILEIFCPDCDWSATGQRQTADKRGKRKNQRELA